MIGYFLEIIAIQLTFLWAYDLFLKKETFFQWNRIYLIGAFGISIILPWVKIETLETAPITNFEPIKQFIFQLDEIVLTSNDTQSTFWESLSWGFVVQVVGALVMLIFLGIKLNHIYRLMKSGFVSSKKNYTEVIVPQSRQAFSFFNYIFLGEHIPEQKREDIISHELVHVGQKHSLDLMYFEIMRIVFWFNPLVYIFQNRLAEVHEFIADAESSKSDKKKQYETLLSEIFQSQKISLVNHFYKKSLIKKRIVMLTKQKSSSILRLKYTLLFPVVLSILFYTSCEDTIKDGNNESIEAVPLEEMIITGYSSNQAMGTVSFPVNDLKNLTVEEKERMNEIVAEMLKSSTSIAIQMKDKSGKLTELKMTPEEEMNKSGNNQKKEIGVPFAVVDEIPIFPGCEGELDKKACFISSVNKHIRKHFRYPEEAKERGIQGRVNVIFVIDKEGNIKDIRKRGPHELLENEVVRIIEKLPKMLPGKHEGQETAVPFSVPVTFKLQ